MFHKLRPEFMPTEEIKKVNRPKDWAYLSTALMEAGNAVNKALNEGQDSDLIASVGHYRQALAEVTRTSFARNAADRTKVKALEDRLMRFASDLNKALIARDRVMVRSALLSVSYPE